MKKFLIRSCVGIFLFALAPNLAQAETATPVSQALDYIALQQNTDGGVREKDKVGSELLQTDWSLIAFSSAGINPDSVATNSDSLVDFAENQACGYSAATDIERSVMALSAANYDLNKLDCDLTSRLAALADPTSGRIGSDVVSTVFGVFAFKAADLTLPSETLNYLISNQQTDGGWTSGWGTESNLTAQAIQALMLLSGDKNLPSIERAKTYIKSLQTEDGGIKYSTDPWTTGPDAFSDAYTLQAIYSLGEHPSDDFWSSNGNSILNHLLGYQKENGSFRFSTDPWGDLTPVWTTAIVLPSLSGQFYPVRSTELKPFHPILEIIETPTPSPVPIVSPKVSPTNSAQSNTAVSDRTTQSQTEIASSFTIVNQDDATTTAISNTDAPIMPSPQVFGSQDSQQSDYSFWVYLLLGLGAGTVLIIALHRTKLVPVILLAAVLLSASKAEAADGNIGLLIRHSDGSQKSYCLNSPSFPVSSEDIFKLGSIQFSFDRGFLVGLDNENASSAWQENADKNYWSHWIDQGSGLTYANYGAQARIIQPNSVDAWQIGSSQKLLTEVRFPDICAGGKVSASESATMPSNVEPTSTSSRITRTSPAQPPVAANLDPTATASPVQSAAPQVLGEKNERAKTPKIMYFILGLVIPLALIIAFKKFRKAG